MSASRPSADDARSCPFCGLTYSGSPTRCSRCGTLLGEAARDLGRPGDAERRLLRSRKALADTLFLVGLLLGGPMISLGKNTVAGFAVVLAGGLASVLRRYTDWSLAGSITVAALASLALTAWVVEPTHQAVEETRAMENARGAYVEALSAQNPDIHVEGRGVGEVAIWFTVPDAELAGSCGSYPPTKVRAHLGELGFLRVVVETRNQSGGLCSFVP